MSDPPFIPQERGERFEIRGRLGSGGMGVVFEAFDRWRNEIVALKKLIQTEPSSIFRLKHEFRALADIAHPNLVSLYELVNQGEEWLFTMELVRGRNFLAYLQPVTGFGSGAAEDETVAGSDRMTRRTFSSESKIESGSDPVIAIPHSDSGPPPFEATLVQEDGQKPVTPQRHLTPDPVTPPPVVPPRAPESDCPVQIDVLRPALRQLAEGVAALHRAGKLHRDLKPSNVLVTPQGRVVILDFGLVSDVEPGRKLTFAGTPAYMAPEQLADQPATEASDWYAVGLMLYEALTGTLPFGGDSPYAMLMEKQRGELTPPSELVRGVPADLDRLCVDLLRREPESRPGGQEVLQRLSKRSTDRLPAPKAASLDVPFVGRDRELRQMHDAFGDARESPVVVLIHGRSGMGKSALVRRFIDEARAKDRSIVVLTGRCYEQESVPYKALDSLVDDLTQYLRSLRPLEAKAMMPVNIGALTRLFPVLEGVEAARRERRKAVDVVDSQQLRRRAFAALREMMARIVDERPVVLFLDDLQWGDRDSAAAIAEILRPPDAPPLLLVAAYRREESETSPFVGELHKQREDRTLTDVREIALDELGGDAARKLARALLGADASEQRIHAVAREAAGSPFFIHEIGRFATGADEPAADAGAEEDAPSSLDDLIRARVARLSSPAQDLLEVVALAGQPIEASIARDAARIPLDDLHAVVSTLRGAHLMRTRVRGGREEIVAYHDRIREAIVHRMAPPRRRAWHLRLANTLESVGWHDPELLAVHYQGAGETERAAVLALAAADKAAGSLAFDHAARLYRLALELQGYESAPPRRVAQLADALGNAGHAFEAAQHYLRVAQALEGHDALEMRRRAAELLLRSGRVDEGLAAFRDVLSSVGIKLPASRKRALFGLLLRKVFQRLRGLRFDEREASAVPAELLLRVDVLWAALVGLSRTDILLAIYFQTKHLRLALRAGEPYRVARALALEAGFTSSGGGKSESRTNFLLARLFHYARKTDVPHAVGIAHLTAAIAAFLVGRFRDAAAEAQQADELFRTRCTGVWWEMNTAQNYVLTSLAYLGRIEMLSQRVFAQLREAEERGDLYAITDMVGRVSIIWLAVDEPDAARRALRSAMSHWSTQSFHLQHIYALYTDAQIDIYNDRPREAWEFVQERWPAFTGSKLLRIQMARIESAFLHGRVALAAAAESGDEPLIAHAEQDAKRILRENMRWALPFALMLEGGAAKLRGHTARARERFEQAVGRLEKSEMLLHAAAARRRLGELTPGATGQALIHEADEWMRAQRVRRPEKIANVLAPM